MIAYQITTIQPKAEELARFHRSYGINHSAVFNGTPCHDWLGSPNKGGYGRFQTNKIRIHAHRWIYLVTFGLEQPEQVVDHLCKRRICVNPLHLEAVPFAVNIKRGNSVPGQNSRATHCFNGHPLTQDNLVKLKNRTSRRCKICHRNKAKAKRFRLHL